MIHRCRLIASLVLLGAAACSSPEMPATASVQFQVQSPFCGPNAYPLRFSIDQVVVGTDTLRDGQLSPRFVTSPGQHRLGATVTGGVFSNFTLDTAVALVPNAVLTQIVDLYCS